MKVVGNRVEIEVDGMEWLTIVVDGTKEDINIKQLLSIDDSDLDGELRNNPPLYGWYATVLAHYEYHRAVEEEALEELRAQVATRVRREFWDSRKPGQKDITETQIKEAVLQDPDVKEKSRYVLRVKLVSKKLRALVMALEEKGNRLAQLYSKYRRQLEREGG